MAELAHGGNHWRQCAHARFALILAASGKIDLLPSQNVCAATGIGAGQFDRVLVTGLLTFGGTLALNSSGYTAVFGNSVDLFNWSTTSGTFSTITGTDLGGGLSWDTSSLYTDGVITVVPEPATWALLAAGLTVTMVLRRRRS